MSSLVKKIRARGLPVHEIEPAALNAEFLGLSLKDGKFLRIKPKNVWRLHAAISGLLRRGWCSGYMLRAVLGHVTWTSMLRREVLTVLQSSYSFVAAYGEKQARIWKSVAMELATIRDLLPHPSLRPVRSLAQHAYSQRRLAFRPRGDEAAGSASSVRRYRSQLGALALQGRWRASGPRSLAPGSGHQHCGPLVGGSGPKRCSPQSVTGRPRTSCPWPCGRYSDAHIQHRCSDPACLAGSSPGLGHGRPGEHPGLSGFGGPPRRSTYGLHRGRLGA